MILPVTDKSYVPTIAGSLKSSLTLSEIRALTYEARGVQIRLPYPLSLLAREVIVPLYLNTRRPSIKLIELEDSTSTIYTIPAPVKVVVEPLIRDDEELPEDILELITYLRENAYGYKAYTTNANVARILRNEGWKVEIVKSIPDAACMVATRIMETVFRSKVF